MKQGRKQQQRQRAQEAFQKGHVTEAARAQADLAAQPHPARSATDQADLSELRVSPSAAGAPRRCARRSSFSVLRAGRPPLRPAIGRSSDFAGQRGLHVARPLRFFADVLLQLGDLRVVSGRHAACGFLSRASSSCSSSMRAPPCGQIRRSTLRPSGCCAPAPPSARGTLSDAGPRCSPLRLCRATRPWWPARLPAAAMCRSRSRSTLAARGT